MSMTTPLWTSADIEAATGGDAAAAFDVTGTLSIDTRSLKPGDLFVALKDQRDGHDFVDAAFAAGAAGALVSRKTGDHPQVIVPDVLAALEAMGVAARMRSDALRYAVTGSAGKTSVKDMLAQIFRAAGPAHWSVKSFNNHWGVPLTLARMPEATQRAVFEIGMSTPGEIAPRSRLVRPHIGIVTMIGGAHLAGVGSLDGVALEKSQIFEGLEAGGTAILPAESDYLDYLTAQARAMCPTATVETFGTSADATARIVDYTTDGTNSVVKLAIVGRDVSVSLSAVGAHWAMNAAAALLAASRSGMSIEAAAEALSGYAPPAGRGTADVLPLPGGGRFTLVDDAYNANPASMRAALSALASRSGARRLVALGDMLEIGAGETAAHTELAEPMAAAGVALAFLAGPRMAHLATALPAGLQHVAGVKADDLFETVENALKDGDVLLIKGSNASGMGRLADHLRQWSAAADQQVMKDGAIRAAKGQDAL